MRERRNHPRTSLAIDVRITHPDIDSMMLLTRDISESGIYVVTDGNKLPPVGSVIEGQVQGAMENPPLVRMEVVRIEPGGVGLRFLDSD
jgi:hypothetical protein